MGNQTHTSRCEASRNVTYAGQTSGHPHTAAAGRVRPHTGRGVRIPQATRVTRAKDTASLPGFSVGCGHLWHSHRALGESPVEQGSPAPGPWTGASPWPVGNQTTKQVSGERAKHRGYIQPPPSASISASAPPQIIRRQILTGAPVPGAAKVGDRWPRGRGPWRSREQDPDSIRTAQPGTHLSPCPNAGGLWW